MALVLIIVMDFREKINGHVGLLIIDGRIKPLQHVLGWAKYMVFLCCKTSYDFIWSAFSTAYSSP